MKGPLPTNRIFIIEDDPVYLRMLEYLLKLDPEHEVIKFTAGREAIAALHLKPILIFLDYNLPDLLGTEVLRRLKGAGFTGPIVALSGQQEVAVAVEMLKAGAYDYIIKNEGAKERILHLVQNVKRNELLQQEVEELRAEVQHTYDFEKLLVGKSQPMRAVFQLLQKAASSDITVSIFGETGTGKEVAAKAIHYNSRRRAGPFIAVNMGAVPRELVESELFGHEKGAFTGAIARQKGKFEQAQKGSIFLDEIGELELPIQAKLLRVLQERELTRIGGAEVTPLDVRVMLATHRNLQDEVRQGNFREDLYYRLLGLTVDLPPLRSRAGDVLMLAKHFLDDFAKRNQLGKLVLAEDARRKLNDHNFPGNVRELRAVIELAAVMASNGIVTAADITFPSLRRAQPLVGGPDQTLAQHTEHIIQFYLEKYNHNVVQVANILGIGKSTLYRMLKEKGSTSLTSEAGEF